MEKIVQKQGKNEGLTFLKDKERDILNKFENAVFNKYVNTKEWLKKATMRALKTAVQVFLSLLVLIILGEISWRSMGLVVLISAILSLIFSVAGIPEVQADYTMPKITEDMDVTEVVERVLKQGTIALAQATELTKELKGIKVADVLADEEDEESEDEDE